MGKQLYKPHYIYSVECHEAGGLVVTFVYLITEIQTCLQVGPYILLVKRKNSKPRLEINSHPEC